MEDPGTITVRSGTADYALSPGDRLSFGRSLDCTLRLDPDDLAISRVAGRVEHDGPLWWIVNASSSRSLGFVDEYGLRSVLPPGKRRAVEGPSRILVDGVERTHQIVLEPAVPAGDHTAGPAADAAGEPTRVGEQVTVNEADRAALLALFAGYLEEGPRYDPNPKSYAAAAARLGWPRTTLVKRVEYLRSRLSAAGVPNLQGYNALNHLAEYALTTSLITRADLEAYRRS